MGNKVRLKLDPTQKILLKRGLNKNGAAQRFFSNELRRKMDPYVPMRSGVLKNTAVVHERWSWQERHRSEGLRRS